MAIKVKISENKETCYGCTACAYSCPVHAISMKTDDEGFQYPEIDQNKCIDCGLCEKICRQHDITNKSEPEIYAAINQSLSCRESSSSGGAFYALAEYIIEKHGIVYGAGFGEQFEVKHMRIVTLKGLDKLKGSKYVQSNLGNTFQKVKEDLSADRYVLFSGTPCQVSGLKAYLREEYAKLYLCDIVCHGTPSPMIWEKYIQWLQKEKKIQSVSFRDKTYGWRTQALCVDYGKEKYIKKTTEDPYYIMYFAHYMMRPSCHQCVYASQKRCSDITLGDFWEIEKSIKGKKLDDNKGVSLVFINTPHGKELFNKITDKIKIAASNMDEAYQVIFDGPSKISPSRKAFWEYYHSHAFEEVIHKYGKLTWKDKLIKKVVAPLTRKLGIYQFAQKVYFLRKV